MIDKKILTIGNQEEFCYSSKNGSFFTYDPKTSYVGNQYQCRETFGYYFRRQMYIGFHRTPMDIEKVNEFWEHLENSLKIKNKSIFYRTQNENVIVLKLSPFWRTNNFRKGFATLFLRCAVKHYHNKQFMKSFSNYGLAKRILPVIRRFLDGYVNSRERNANYNIVDYFQQNVFDNNSKRWKYGLRPDWQERLVKP